MPQLPRTRTTFFRLLYTAILAVWKTAVRSTVLVCSSRVKGVVVMLFQRIVLRILFTLVAMFRSHLRRGGGVDAPIKGFWSYYVHFRAASYLHKNDVITWRTSGMALAHFYTPDSYERFVLSPYPTRGNTQSFSAIRIPLMGRCAFLKNLCDDTPSWREHQ